jgi:FlaA1/EpsC-like NDP-sugar epimerase
MAQFNAASTALEFAAALKEQIHGKKVLITGPSIGGLGFEAAISIASRSPALLVLAGRSREKLDAAAAKINEKYPNVEVPARWSSTLHLSLPCGFLQRRC